jgi:hypothetical protein
MSAWTVNAAPTAAMKPKFEESAQDDSWDELDDENFVL